MAYFNLTNELDEHLLVQGVKKENVPSVIGEIYYKFAMIKHTDYFVVGYGSLMNIRSAKRTLVPAVSIPITINGWQRIFNLKSEKDKCTYLNVRENKEAKSICLAHKVSYTDMFDFILRERNYDLVFLDQKSVKFGPRTQKERTEQNSDCPIAMVVATEKEQLSSYEPNMSYVQAVINGASKIGIACVNNIVNDCVLGDGVTNIKKWLETVNLVEYFSKNDSRY